MRQLARLGVAFSQDNGQDLSALQALRLRLWLNEYPGDWLGWMFLARVLEYAESVYSPA